MQGRVHPLDARRVDGGEESTARLRIVRERHELGRYVRADSE
jgi:hypothetical protein